MKQISLDIRGHCVHLTRNCFAPSHRQNAAKRSRSAVFNHQYHSSHIHPHVLVHSSNSDIQDPSIDNPQIDDTNTFQFHKESTLPIGRVVITPLSQQDIAPASVVLTRAFATSPQGIPIDECRSYCQSMVSMPPKGVFLVARLFPLDQQEAPWLRPGQESRVIATAAISFDPISRDTFLKLKPPDEDAYLCNIAVDPSFRRQGVARCMLDACEELTLKEGLNKIYLHVRLGDDAARLLYESSGFVEIASDSWLVKLRNQTPTALLLKQL